MINDEKFISEILEPYIFNIYQKLKKTQIYINITKKLGYVPCVFPDCKQYVRPINNDTSKVTCLKGHKFCVKCKQKHEKNQKNCHKVLLFILTNSVRNLY